MLRALLFDLDGTLVRSNDLHVDAWMDALHACGYGVGRDRIEPEIGKQGMPLLRAVLGEEVAASEGKRLDALHGEAWKARAKEAGIQLYDGVQELFEATASLGLRAALATSSGKADVALVEKLAGLRLSDWLDQIATFDDAKEGKPAPDIVHAACKKLKEDPLACALVGDAVADAYAARNAGASFIGVLQGFASQRDFLDAGARFVAQSVADLAKHLDEAVRAADRTQVPFDARRLHDMMDPALRAAEDALEANEGPMGAALFDAAGELIASEHDRVRATGDATAHAHMVLLRGVRRPLGKGGVLVSTVEPCAMCFNAALEVGIDVVVFGADAPEVDLERVRPPRRADVYLPRVRRDVRADEAKDLVARWRAQQDSSGQRPYAEQLLGEVAHVA